MAISVSTGNVKFITFTMTADDGQSIANDTMQVVALPAGVKPDQNTVWLTPEVVSQAGAVIVARITIDASYPLGTYFGWARIADGGQVFVERAPEDIEVT